MPQAASLLGCPNVMTLPLLGANRAGSGGVTEEIVAPQSLETSLYTRLRSQGEDIVNCQESKERKYRPPP